MQGICNYFLFYSTNIITHAKFEPYHFYMRHTFLLLGILMLLSGCKDEDENAGETNNPPDPSVPPTISYNTIKEIPHDTASFTQGLAFNNGEMYESTGSPEIPSNNGTWIGQVNLATGQATRKVDLGKQWFGEGITFLNGKIFQLTYQTKKGFVYDAKTFKKLKEFSYSTEGWGLTNDGKFLIMSDGTSSLYFLDPDSLRVQNITGVTDNNGPVSNINELEYINGFIYANQWLTPYILKIDPASGKVVGRLDLTQLLESARVKNPDLNELNGIAYDSTSGKVYVTGKKWPTMYEIKFQ